MALTIPQYYTDLLNQRLQEIERDDTVYWIPLGRFLTFAVNTLLAPQLVEEPFYEIAKRLLSKTRDHKITLFARGHAKTSIMKCLVAFLCCEGGGEFLGGDRVRVCFLGESKKFGQRNSKAVKRVLETNSYIYETYGSIKPDMELMRKARELALEEDREFSKPEWTMAAFRTALCLKAEIEDGNSYEEPTVTAVGMDESTTGAHYDVIIIDDPVTEKSSKSQARKAKAYSTYLDMQSQLNPGGLNIVVGTRHALDDIHHTVLTVHADEFEIEVHNCWGDEKTDLWLDDFTFNNDGSIDFNFDPDAVSVFWHGFGQLEHDVKHGPRPEPERKHEALRALARKMRSLKSRQRWAHQYLNVAVASEDHTFFEWMFKTHSGPIPRRVNGYTLTDSATGADNRASYRVVAVVQLDENDVAYVPHLEIGYWGPQEYMSKVLDATLRYGTRFIAMERVSWQATFKTVLRMICEKKGIQQPRVKDVEGRTVISKIERIEALEPRLREGKLLFGENLRVETSPNGQSVFDEMVSQFLKVTDVEGVRGLKVDIPDALSDLEHYTSDGRRLCKPPKNRRQEAPDPHRLRMDSVMEPRNKRVRAAHEHARNAPKRDLFRPTSTKKDLFS